MLIYGTVHWSFNALRKEPILSMTAKLVSERTPQLISSPSGWPCVWKIGKGQIKRGESIEVDLFPLTMNFVGEIATTAIMGRAFVDNNPGIMEDLWAFDAGFNAILLGLPTIRLRRSKAARARMHAAMNEWDHAVLASMNGKDTEHKWGDLSDV